MTIILSDDYLYQTFSPLRKKNDKYMFFSLKFKGHHNIGCDSCNDQILQETKSETSLSCRKI
jgi:hypothetical protein